MKLELIKIGSVYENRTLKYLAPGLKEYGSTFISKFSQLASLGCFIFDASLDNNPFFTKSQPNIFFLIDTYYNAVQTEKVLTWFKYQNFYVADYTFAKEHISPRFCILVIKYPKPESYKAFLEGKYSKMYTIEEINSYFNTNVNLEAKQVLLKKENAIKKHIQIIQEEFGVRLLEKEVIEPDYELDFPFIEFEEILNI